jgi:uncharacterized membrane protein
MDLEDDLRRQMADISVRVAALEAELRALRDGPSISPGIAKAHPDHQKAADSLPYPTMADSFSQGGKARGSSLESRIGAQLLNRIGILVVLIGVAWFLKLAFDYNWIGPSVRVLIGLACSAGLMVWSQRFRRRGFFPFSYSLKAIASSIAYLSLWAAFSLYHLAPSSVVFLAMTGVTVVNAMLACRQDSELLAIYAMAGGLATPALLWTAHGDHFFLFVYLVLLNGGGLLLLALHPWKRLAWAALMGTALYYVALSEYQAASLPWTIFFLALYFANFAAVPFLVERRADARPDPVFAVAFPIANGLATFLAFLWLFAAPGQQPWRIWATALLALACLLMARCGPVRLSRTNLGLGIFFVTVALGLEFDRPVVTLCWLGEALVLFVLTKAQGHVAMRVFAAAVLGLAALSLAVDWFFGSRHPQAVVANLHFATNLAAAAVFAAVARLSPGNDQKSRYLAGFSTIAFSLTVLVAASLEIHHYWFCGAGFFRDLCGGYGQLRRRENAAGWDNTAWYMLYGAALMAVGFLRRSAFLRWQALVLLAFTIAKVFLNGVSQQGEGYRVLTFLALGVLLLAVSFAYQKDWLQLRGKDTP